MAWATHFDEVRQAHTLRCVIFAGEIGARLSTCIPGHDVDVFDDGFFDVFDTPDLVITELSDFQVKAIGAQINGGDEFPVWH